MRYNERVSWILVGLGGAAGSLLRYGMAKVVALAGLSGAPGGWPWATFAVNVIGSISLGVLWCVTDAKDASGQNLRFLLGTGLMGGFTTYSSFNLETLQLFQAGQHARGVAYVLLTVAICLLGGYVGVGLGQQVR